MKVSKLLLLSILFLSAPGLVYSQWWAEQNSGVTVNLKGAYSGYFSSDAWVCGFSGTVLRTGNNGTNWLNVSGNGIPNDVSLVTISAGYLGTYVVLTAGNRADTSFVYRSTNVGQSWTQVFRQNGGRLNAISRIDNSGKVFMQGNPVGGRWSLWKSTNAGATWDSSGMRVMQNGSEVSANNSIMSGTNIMLFGTNNGRLYFTTNNGTTWRTILTPLEPSPTAIDGFIHFTDTSFSAYAGGTNRIITTNNGGYTWDTVRALPGGVGLIGSITVRPLPVDLPSEFGQAIYVRNDNKIYKKVQSGQWYTEYTAPGGNYNYTSKSMGGCCVWAVRDNGGISYCLCPLSGVENNNNQIPEKFALYQNYPNPFNPVTMIKFDVPSNVKRETSNVNLTVYDVNGRVVETLVDKELQPGSYSFDWHASNYASGVYYYVLTTNEFKESKKMLLLK
jgi:photosystem II stability/assembly factor-like uncharacterized protein